MSKSSAMNQILATLSCMLLECVCNNEYLSVIFNISFVAGNIITFSFGAGLSFTTCSYMLWISDETPLPSGKMTIFEASLVTSLMCIGCLIGNILFALFSEKFGRKIPLLFLAIPQIVSLTVAHK